MRILLAALLVVTAMAKVAAAQCVDPTAFGAVARDDRDDRIAIQTAWAAACALQQKLCIPDGRFEATRRPLAGAANIGSIQLSCAGAGYVTSCLDIDGQPLVGMEVYGAGMNKTSLNMLGDSTFPGHPGPPSKPPAWTLLQPRSINGLCIRDLALTGDRRGRYTSDQTHLLEILGPASDVVVERVTGFLPQAITDEGNDWGGDCFRTVGTNLDRVERTVFRDMLIGPCYRTGIIIQRGSFDTLVEGSSVRCERDKQSMDLEASAGGDIVGFSIRNTSFSRQPGAIGSTIAFDGVGDSSPKPDGGVPDEPIKDVIFEDVVIEDGGFVIDDVRGMIMSRVRINSGLSQSPTIQIVKHAADITCVDCRIERPAGAPAGNVVQATAQGGRTPHSIRFVKGSIWTGSLSAILYSEGLDEFHLEGTTIRYTGPTPNSPSPMLKMRGLDTASDPRLLVLAGVVAEVGALSGLAEWVISEGGTGGTVTIRDSWIVGAVTTPFVITGQMATPPVVANVRTGARSAPAPRRRGLP